MNTLLCDYLNACDHNPPTLQTEWETDGQTDDFFIATSRYARTWFAQ